MVTGISTITAGSARREVSSGSFGTMAIRVCSPGRYASTMPAGFTPTERRRREKNTTVRSIGLPSASRTSASSVSESPTSSSTSDGVMMSSAGSGPASVSSSSWANAGKARRRRAATAAGKG